MSRAFRRLTAWALAAGVPLSGGLLLTPTATATGFHASAGRSLEANAATASLVPAPGTTNELESTNWSGYASLDKSVHGIEATWTVPRVTSHSPTLYSATWVGVDGFDNIKTLIQCGTSQDSNGQYNAWYELLPAYETPLALRVAPGNVITAKVGHDGGAKSDHWTMTLINHSRHWTWSKNVVYKSPDETTEVIEESPQINGRVGRIADFHSVDFRDILMKFPAGDWATGNYQPANKITLVTGSGKVQARPQALAYQGGQAFKDLYKG